MRLVVAIVIAGVSVVLLLAGVRGSGQQLFQTLTGTGAASGGSPSASGSASAAPAQPAPAPSTTAGGTVHNYAPGDMYRYLPVTGLR